MTARNPYRGGKQITSRHLWLAALGAVAIARREALTAAAIAADELTKLRRNASAFAGDARDVARGAAMTLEEIVGQRIAPEVSRIEARLSPVLERLRGRPARKPAPRSKPRRASGARRQATTRVARKGRG